MRQIPVAAAKGHKRFAACPRSKQKMKDNMIVVLVIHAGVRIVSRSLLVMWSMFYPRAYKCTSAVGG